MMSDEDVIQYRNISRQRASMSPVGDHEIIDIVYHLLRVGGSEDYNSVGCEVSCLILLRRSLTSWLT